MLLYIDGIHRHYGTIICVGGCRVWTTQSYHHQGGYDGLGPFGGCVHPLMSGSSSVASSSCTNLSDIMIRAPSPWYTPQLWRTTSPGPQRRYHLQELHHFILDLHTCIIFVTYLVLYKVNDSPDVTINIATIFLLIILDNTQLIW